MTCVRSVIESTKPLPLPNFCMPHDRSSVGRFYWQTKSADFVDHISSALKERCVSTFEGQTFIP